MLERFKLLLKLEAGKERPLRHLAITTHGIEAWAVEHKVPIQEAYQRSFSILYTLVEQQIKNNVPLLTIYLLQEGLKKEEYFPVFLDALTDFLKKIKTAESVHKHKLKISALGKWYDLPSRAVESIREVIEETKDYDNFFLNLCINYNGQEEIVDACRLIARQIKADKLDVDSITKETIKDNLYSSYFLPPSLIIKNGKRKQTAGLLLWDSVYADVYFTQKYFPDFKEGDFIKAIENYKKE